MTGIFPPAASRQEQQALADYNFQLFCKYGVPADLQAVLIVQPCEYCPLVLNEKCHLSLLFRQIFSGTDAAVSIVNIMPAVIL
jgi:hypothetical protein